MEKIRCKLTLATLCLCLLWISGLASIPSKYSLGIDPKDEIYYKSNVIKCKDGSRKFTREQLNDDFCDCVDGTDEPGTSACPEGRFYCQNAGHIPLTIFSSRVNDGICDCCDGSDEYDGKVNCPNSCWEAGKVAREKLNNKIKTYQEGVIIRKKEVEKAKQALVKDEEDLSKLKTEEKILKELVDKLKDHKERIEKAEEEERLKKEKEEKIHKEAEMKAKEQEESSDEVSHDTADNVPESLKKDASEEGHDTEGEAERHQIVDSSANHAIEQHAAEDHVDTYISETADKESPNDIANQKAVEDQGVTLPEDGSEEDSSHVEKEQGASADTSGLSKEELGRLVASRWTGENTAHETEEASNALNTEVHQEIPDNVQEEDDKGYNSEVDDDRHKYDDDDFEDDADEEYEDAHVESEGSYDPKEDDKDAFPDFSDSGSTTWLDKIKETVQNVLSPFNFFKTPVDLSEADHVRKEYDDSKSKLSKIQSRISSLTQKLKHDFGKDKEFYSFYDRCFENKQNKYIYKVCPFKEASQNEGHSSSQLGKWEKFDLSYRVMQFSGGDKCWNGPDRSLKVRLRCGLTNELTDVDEPSRCEYEALLSTPALCSEDKLKELQQKLEQMNSRQPKTNDEL